uniref:Uncharacterized protein n=1 Tax=Anguilla anguilla TaxID=7936 RepID=A0A0E9SWK0_ANGAN
MHAHTGKKEIASTYVHVYTHIHTHTHARSTVVRHWKYTARLHCQRITCHSVCPVHAALKRRLR